MWKEKVAENLRILGEKRSTFHVEDGGGRRMDYMQDNFNWRGNPAGELVYVFRTTPSPCNGGKIGFVCLAAAMPGRHSDDPGIVVIVFTKPSDDQVHKARKNAAPLFINSLQV